MAREMIEEMLDSIRGKNYPEDKWPNLESVDAYEINEVYNDSFPHHLIISLNNPFNTGTTDLLFEAVDFATSTNYVVKMLKEYVKLKDWQIHTQKGQNGINVQLLLTDNNNHNFKAIKLGMKLLGYFLTSSEPIIWNDKENRKWYIYQFEPNLQDDNTEEIKTYKYLYHLTPTYNVKSILSKGIEPRSENELFYYPKRVYMLADNDLNNIWSLAYTLCMTNKDNRNDGYYTLIRIDLSKLPLDMKLYYDPNQELSVYTNKTIPPTAITVVAKNKVAKRKN